MELTILPHEGVGPIRFGMPRETVHLAAEGLPIAFRKTADSQSETDAFDDLGIHVHYDETGTCEAVEMGVPAKPMFNGYSFIGVPFREAVIFLENFDPNLEVDPSGLTSRKLGLGLYAPQAKDRPNDPVEGVIVFANGYYG